ncbi:MAG: membrane integrity-associated transporter subunit PqiC [Rhodobiaceae bacterium]|nr:membrane integrity-associated transporter subunit PqiC [Rhodobiaceae bacterium]MCC0055747.1 membrane integrity-associated transporter subunit PqiC [Rhodobiaceae bacterium]
MGRVRLGVLAAATAVALAGCSGVLSGPAPDTYDLSAPTDFGTIGSTRAQILVPVPTALASLDTERIVVRPEPAVINYLSGAQWADKLPRLFQARLVEAFDRSGRVARVGRTGEGLVADYQILAEIRAFHADPTSGIAHAEVAVRIVNDRSGRIVASKTFIREAPLVSKNSGDIVTALAAAMSAAMGDIVGWTVSRI